MTPRMMAKAYYIHAYCEPLEWNVSIQDIADHTGYAKSLVGRILRAKGWITRIRSSVMDFHGFAYE